MGSVTGRPDESPSHPVTVRAFRLGRTPVTHAQYAPFVEAGRAAAPPWWRDPSFGAPDQPVVGVTWFEAMAYARWLGEHGRRRVAPADRGGVGARGARRAGRAATAWGVELPPGEVPEGPLAGPWPAGRGTAERLRPAGHGHDRPRVVPRLVRRAHYARRPGSIRAAPTGRAPREPRRLVAAPRPLVAAFGAEQPAAGLPLRGLRLSRAGGGDVSRRGPEGARRAVDRS